MQICRFWRPDRGPSIGLVQNRMVYDLSSMDSARCGSFSVMLSADDLVERVGRLATCADQEKGWSLAALDVPPDLHVPHLLAPITKQEVWGAGVTYWRSREARMEESAGGGSFYDKVYRAERPELFFKTMPSRVVGPNAPIRVRVDSKWTVPEPELTLAISSSGQLVGYTIGNDVSARDIEGENPLYLPQAKIYKGSCAIGPVVTLAHTVSDPRKMEIRLTVRDGDGVRFEGSTSLASMKRSFEDLIAYLFRELDFPHGVFLLTGTGIVPPDDFTLQHGDVVEIEIPEIGTLRNPVW
ncbi:MAG: fumarylacetoacetate hydrolase family protein [Acidobacteria bacterium]|nr:fumarylacetoacetate hydrolase family protein [Acidobacteriota bacterium]